MIEGPNKPREKIEKQYDEIGAAYREHKGKFSSNVPDEGKEFIYAHLDSPQQKALLDVGCGGGAELDTYRSIGVRDIRGIDPSIDNVRAANEFLGESIVELGSWEHMPFPDASKDYLVGRFSIHYCDDLDEAYTEAARVLKDDGKLLLIIPNPAADTDIDSEDGKEYVHVSLFNGAVKVKYPRHTNEQYFSERFNQLFEIIDRKEYRHGERDDSSDNDTIALIARKR